MIKKIFYWSIVIFLVLATISYLSKNLASLITGISAGFSMAIGSIMANEFNKRSKKVIKKFKEK